MSQPFHMQAAMAKNDLFIFSCASHLRASKKPPKVSFLPAVSHIRRNSDLIVFFFFFSSFFSFLFSFLSFLFFFLFFSFFFFYSVNRLAKNPKRVLNYSVKKKSRFKMKCHLQKTAVFFCFFLFFSARRPAQRCSALLYKYKYIRSFECGQYGNSFHFLNRVFGALRKREERLYLID